MTKCHGVEANRVLCSCVSKVLNCIFHTLVEEKVGVVIVWLRPHRVWLGKKKGWTLLVITYRSAGKFQRDVWPSKNIIDGEHPFPYPSDKFATWCTQ